MGARLRKLLQNGEHIEIRRVAIGIFAARQRARSGAVVSAQNERKKLEQGVGRLTQREILSERPAQWAPAHRRFMRGAEHRNDLVDKAEIVGRKDSKGIADGVVETGASKIEFDAPDLLLRSATVQRAAVAEDRRDGAVAAAPEEREVGRRGHGLESGAEIAADRGGE